MDHKNPTKEAINNGWINPLIAKIVKDPRIKFEISDEDYIEAINHMILLLNLGTGLNTAIGYENSTRTDKIFNLYCIYEREERSTNMALTDKEMANVPEKPMTFREFIESMLDEVDENDMDKVVEFNTSDRLGLFYLSIYEEDGKICIDIGEDDE